MILRDVGDAAKVIRARGTGYPETRPGACAGPRGRPYSGMPTKLAQVVMALSFAAPCFGMGLRLLAVWRDPASVDEGRWVRLGVGIFVLEFIMLHAGIMMGAAAAAADSAALRVGGMLGLTAFYAIFAAAIAFGFKSRMLFTSFLWMVGGRFAAMVIGISAADQALLLAHSVLAMLIYFPVVFASVILPWPRLGITDAVAEEARVPGSGGLWVEQPHRAIGPAAVYFLLLGPAEITLMTWVDPTGFRAGR